MSDGESTEEVTSFPVMTTIPEGVVVKRPECDLVPPQTWEYGGVSVGSHQIPGAGVQLIIALHHPDGTTLTGTFRHDALVKFATKANGEIARISNGLAHRQ